MLKVTTATAAFGVVHSVLASRTAKRAAARRFGERNHNGLYRVVYIGQSFVTFGLLAAYIRRQPSRELYRVEGPLAWLMHAGQAGAVVYAKSAAGQAGLRRITGLDSFLAWLDDGPVRPEDRRRVAEDREKSAAAAIAARQHAEYVKQKKLHKEKYEGE